MRARGRRAGRRLPRERASTRWCKAAAERGWIDGPAVALEHAHRHQAGRRRLRPHLLRRRGRRGARWPVTAATCGDRRPTRRGSRGPAVIPAASTRRCGPSARSAGRLLRGRGDGAYADDVDGTRYLDYVQSWGASILGHAHPEVLRPSPRGRRGTTFGAPTAGEVLLAEAHRRPVPGLELVRLVSSGTEAAMTRGPPRSRGHRARPDREVRRLLPRPLRRPARRGRQRGGDARAAGLGRRARRGAVADTSSRPTTSCPSSTRPSPA